MITDKNDIEIVNGDIIDIHQTVNGQNLFIVYIVDGKYEATYLDGRSYEYDVMALLEDGTDIYKSLSGLVDKTIEIVGNYIKDRDDKINSILK